MCDLIRQGMKSLVQVILLDAGDSRGISALMAVASRQPPMRVGTLYAHGYDLDFFPICALALTLAGCESSSAIFLSISCMCRPSKTHCVTI